MRKLGLVFSPPASNHALSPFISPYLSVYPAALCCHTHLIRSTILCTEAADSLTSGEAVAKHWSTEASRLSSAEARGSPA